VAARGLARNTDRPVVLLTSPLPRARATAEIVARAFERMEPTIEPAVAHDSVDGIIVALKTQSPGGTAAVVGHEPTLSALIARLQGVSEPGRLAFEKGGPPPASVSPAAGRQS
jgi:phosphohistidine phosphatase